MDSIFLLVQVCRPSCPMVHVLYWLGTSALMNPCLAFEKEVSTNAHMQSRVIELACSCTRGQYLSRNALAASMTRKLCR
jgi:hypothetical protein